MKRRATGKPRASANDILTAIDAEIEVQTMEDMPVSVTGRDGMSTLTSSRRRKSHVRRDENDREAAALPDRPPPGWCET